MIRKTGQDPDTFFWVRKGEEKAEPAEQRIHSIHFEDEEEVPPITPRAAKRRVSESKRAGLKKGWVRATIIVQEDSLSKLKALAYWNRKGIKDVVDEAFSAYLQGKKIRPVGKS